MTAWFVTRYKISKNLATMVVTDAMMKGAPSFGSSSWWPALVLLPVFLVSFWSARDLNLLSSGALKAESLGVNVSRLRSILFLCAAALTATAVTLAGAIGRRRKDM